MNTKLEKIFRKGKRVNLRTLTEEDAPNLAKWMNDEEVAIFITQFMPQTVESEIDWIRESNNRKDEYVFGIETTEGVLIGNISVFRINYIHRTAYTGAVIGEKEYWNKGYGSEAKLLLLKYIFDTLNVRKVCSSAIAFNERSINYQKKTGGKIEGVRKNQIYKDGKYWDEVLLAVYREDWLPIWERYQETGKI